MANSNGNNGIRQTNIDESVIFARFEKLQHKKDPMIHPAKSENSENMHQAVLQSREMKTITKISGISNQVDEMFLEDEEFTKPVRISRVQRKLYKAIKKEEEERPMIFFEKTNPPLIKQSNGINPLTEKNNEINPFTEQKNASESPTGQSRKVKSMEEHNSEAESMKGQSNDAKPMTEQRNDIKPTESKNDGKNDEKISTADSLENEPEAPENGKRDRVMREFFDWAKHILIAVCAGLLLVIFVIQRNVVIGSSMEPNLYENDQLFVEKISKLFPAGIAFGDIITIEAEGLQGHTGDKNIIKRVIGVPGDKVDINDDGVYRNGKKITEPYIDGAITVERNPAFSHVTLGENQYYVLGDNREVSLDSRIFGPINKTRIVGEVLVRFYPLIKIGKP